MAVQITKTFDYLEIRLIW